MLRVYGVEGSRTFRVHWCARELGLEFASIPVHFLDGIEVPIISLYHLKVNKRASGRHKDLNDLENLP